MNRCLRYVVILTLCVNNAFAQLLPFKHYRSKDGLISDKVSAVIRDQKGLLWVGTDFGVNWYDGNRFVKPDIQLRTGQLYVTNFFKDNQSNIWVLSFYNGIYKFENGRFINFLPDSSRLESNANTALDMIQYDQTRFIVATDQNVYWFDGNRFSEFDPQNPRLNTQITTITTIGNQWILFAHPHGLFVYKNDHDHWLFFGEFFKELEINKILVADEEIWLATRKGLYMFEQIENLIKQKPSRSLFATTLVTDVYENKTTGDLWVTADQLYKLHGTEIKKYTTANGLVAVPGKIYIDKEEIIWMCSGKGLTKMAKPYYVFYDLRKGPSHSMINAMAYDDENNLWLGTYDGFGCKSPNYFSAHRSIHGKKIGYVPWIQHTKKYGLLAGSTLGILSVKKDDMTVKYPVQTSKAFEDDEGILFTGTVDGKVYKIENERLSELTIKPFLGDFIDALYKDRFGYLWIGYRTNGVRKYAMNGDECMLVKEYSNNTGYKDLRIRCCYADKKGNLVFGTRTNGLFVISLNDNRRVWRIGSAQGLSGNWIRNINEDAQGTLYLATNQGLNLLSGNYDRPFIRKVNLLNEEVDEQTTAIIIEPHNVMVGTEEGLIEYYPQIDNNRSSPPVMFITEISINGKMDSLLPPYLSYGEKKLAVGDNLIAFGFTGVNLKDHLPLQYRYKLEGHDDDWVYARERNFVSYHLTPGSYVFKAEARNSFGQWSSRPATFAFLIPAPFWSRWWFIGGVILLLAIFLFLLYRYRVHQALKLERLRHRISTDLHDDIGSTLSSISILSEIASRETNGLQSGNMMQEIKHSSVSLMEKMDDIVWSINPNNDSIENLMLRIKRFASKLLEAKDIDYTIDIAPSIQKIKLDMESRQHIYLIMKEAINNQVKYSNCTRSYIGVRYDQNHLQIEITDNGQGFNDHACPQGNGMLSMKSRAQVIGGVLEVITKPGEGTTILLQTKIK